MTYEERGKELCRECSMNKTCPYIPRKVEYKCQHLSDMMYGWELGRRDTINKAIEKVYYQHDVDLKESDIEKFIVVLKKIIED